jgi:putative protease
MKKKIELLAPAGDMDSLVAAINAGADAIYLAGRAFGARKYATNFDDEEMTEAVKYAHLRNKKIYVTVNTIVSDGEFPKLTKFVDFLVEIGADAVIVQDLGVLRFLKKRYKNIEIHASTQMSLCSEYDVKVIKDHGVNRVVLPREMKFDEIAHIKKNVDVELEVFVQGALCISYSGQCLMSSIIGGRSGNRGSCAQPCRQKYKLIEVDERGFDSKKIDSKTGEYLLSTKDLCTLESVNDLANLGIHSLKIEGRMKGREYTYKTVNAYRDVLDDQLAGAKHPYIKAAKHDISRIFSRDFTAGHMFSNETTSILSQTMPGSRGTLVGKVVSYDKEQKEMIINLSQDLSKGDDVQIRRKDSNVGGRVEYIKVGEKRVTSASAGKTVTINMKHWVEGGEDVFRTYDVQIMDGTKKESLGDKSKTSVKMRFDICDGEFAILEIEDADNSMAVVKSEMKIEKANNRAITKDRIEEQLSKLGSTSFEAADIEINISGEPSMPVKELNNMRRKAVEELEAAILIKKSPNVKIDKEVSPFDEFNFEKEKTEDLKFVPYVRTLEQLNAVVGFGIEEVYYSDMESFEDAEIIATSNGINLVPAIKRVADTFYIKKLVEKFEGKNFNRMLVGSIGQREAFKGVSKSFSIDYSVNAFNSSTVMFLKDEGFSTVTLSPEMTKEQISEVYNVGVDLEIIGYGRLPVMYTKSCPINGAFINNKENCSICRGKHYVLEDKIGVKFPVVTDMDCNVEILNSSVTLMSDKLDIIKDAGIKKYRMIFTNETADEIEKVIEHHFSALAGKAGAFDIGVKFTHAHLDRGVIL